ncbi:hypothetical protein P9695_08860 [Weizmannia sp. CD-2023]|uniref:hypothetical protein n=1 Tax=Heyndrickxia TaxID=2837504 RepID=UPI002E250885|nr:hypothetical protein [Weizmannia sp. CD-2023]MED4899731.1 hypothetical protein [Weizmannia sp. CD-2023]
MFRFFKTKKYYEQLLADREQSIVELASELQRLEKIINRQDDELDKAYEEKEAFEVECIKLEDELQDLMDKYVYLEGEVEVLESELAHERGDW